MFVFASIKVDLLRQKLSMNHPKLEIKSVDGFQGREKEAVVLSLVRSNRKGTSSLSHIVGHLHLQQATHWLLCSILGEVGFLAEDRRINVAVTRARRHIAVVCDTQTVQNHPFLKSLVGHMTEFGDVRTAFEYIQDIVPQNYTREQKDVKPKSSSGGSNKQKSKVPPPAGKQGQKKTSSGSGGCSSSNTNDVKQELEEHKKKERRAEIKDQVQRFMRDSERSELPFPASFNSHDRLLVHQVAEELGLVHESRGEGRERCITVFKPRNSAPTREQTTEEERVEEAAADEEQKENRQLEVTAPPLVDLKSLHLERMKREQQKREEKAQQRQQHNGATTTTTLSSKKSKTAKGFFFPQNLI